MTSFVEIGFVDLEKEMKMWKVYNYKDKLWSEKLTWALGVGELKNEVLMAKANMDFPFE